MRKQRVVAEKATMRRRAPHIDPTRESKEHTLVEHDAAASASPARDGAQRHGLARTDGPSKRRRAVRVNSTGAETDTCFRSRLRGHILFSCSVR